MSDDNENDSVLSESSSPRKKDSKSKQKVVDQFAAILDSAIAAKEIPKLPGNAENLFSFTRYFACFLIYVYLKADCASLFEDSGNSVAITALIGFINLAGKKSKSKSSNESIDPAPPIRHRF